MNNCLKQLVIFLSCLSVNILLSCASAQKFTPCRMAYPGPPPGGPARENLGANINSAHPELRPVISPDGKTLYFNRDMPRDGSGKTWNKIFYSTLVNGRWTPAVRMGRPLNVDKGNNSVQSVTPDGNTLLLRNVYNEDGTMSGGVSASHRTARGWSFPERLNIINYYNLNKYGGSFLSNDGKTLLLAVERKDSLGDQDIYVSFLRDDDLWSEPMNLGTTINTPGNECTPFLAADGVTLYFSSDGHCTYGSNDIFISRRLDDTWKKWSAPVNMGALINTPGFDAYFFIPASGDYAYMASDARTYGKADIFRIKLPGDLRPKSVFLVSGRVLDVNTKRPLDATVVYDFLPSGKQAGVARTDPATGAYKIVLPPGSKYGVRATARGYFALNDVIDASVIASYKQFEQALYLNPVKESQTVRFKNLYFDFNSSIIRPESYPELDIVANFLAKNPSVSIEIAGHTDEIGAHADNQALSDRRAGAVADYIISRKIARPRVRARGYGKTRPVSADKTEDGRQKNRRVEIRILKV